MTRNIAIYGKGGIGKSTTASNISAALSDEGYRVMQIGCDPKSDFTKTLRGGEFIPTVLDTLRSGKRVEIDGIVHQGYSDILCIEAGGPEPGVGCAGRGIITDPASMQKQSSKELGRTFNNVRQLSGREQYRRRRHEHTYYSEHDILRIKGQTSLFEKIMK